MSLEMLPVATILSTIGFEAFPIRENSSKYYKANNSLLNQLIEVLLF